MSVIPMDKCDRCISPSWFDRMVYKLWYWRWNRIYANRPDLRETMIVSMKVFDVVDVGDYLQYKMTVTKVIREESD